MTALRNFSAVPERAAGDKKLLARELRVLMAICRAVDRNTGVAKISQARIAERASLARQKISGVTAGLEAKGYVQRVDTGRRRDGRQPIAQYRIVYDTAAGERVAPTTGDTASLAPAGDTAQAPTQGTGINTTSQQTEPEAISEAEADPPWRSYRDGLLAEWDRLFKETADVDAT